MRIETFDCNVDISSFECHRALRYAFEMKTYERTPCHNDHIGRISSPTKENMGKNGSPQ